MADLPDGVRINISAQVGSSKRIPRWKRELRLIRKERFRYPRMTYLLWRFHRSVRRAQKAEGYDYD